MYPIAVRSVYVACGILAVCSLFRSRSDVDCFSIFSAGVEDEIQLSRRYYNGAVRNLNTMIQSFPSNFVAGFFKFTTAEFFEIGDAAAREVPKVDFKK